MGARQVSVSATLAVDGVTSTAHATVQVGAQLVKPPIPDGIYPMGYQGPASALKDVGDVNATGDDVDVSGLRIHGRINVLAGGVHGKGFEIVGDPKGSTGWQALINCSSNKVKAANFSQFTIRPDVPIAGLNGVQGHDVTIDDWDISRVIDVLSPSNVALSNSDLNFHASWGYGHDHAWFKNDPAHADGSHADGCQIVDGTGVLLDTVRLTGLVAPDIVKSQGKATPQTNSAIQIDQSPGLVTGILVQNSYLGGGGVTVNLFGSGKQLNFGSLSNVIFGGNSQFGIDVLMAPTTTITLAGNTRVDGKPVVVSRHGS